jgi:type III secretory pathway component EscR
MVQYALILKIPDSQQDYRYTLDLNRSQENNPEQIFTEEITESMKNFFEKNSQCEVSKVNLKKMISRWQEDIAEGYKTTQITLNLPSMFVSNLKKLKDEGNQKLPDLLPPDLSGIEPTGGALPDLIFS